MASDLENALMQQIVDAELPWPQREVRFCKRRWRWDFAWEHLKLAIEVQGGSWLPVSMHGRGTRFEGQCDKLSEAAILGWRVMQFTGGMVKDGRALEFIRRALCDSSNEIEELV